MAVWPPTLPDFVLQEGYEEGFSSTVIRSEMSTGPQKRRRRATAGPKPMTLSLPLTSDELDIFIDFYENELVGGALSFTKPHPRGLGTFSYAITDKQLPPATSIGGENYQITLHLEQLQTLFSISKLRMT